MALSKEDILTLTSAKVDAMFGGKLDRNELETVVGIMRRENLPILSEIREQCTEHGIDTSDLTTGTGTEWMG